MSSAQRILRLLADAKQRLRKTQDEVEKIKSEILALESQLIAAREADAQPRLPLGDNTRGLSEKWAAVLNYMVLRQPNSVSVDELMSFTADNNLNITRSAMRAQLYNYAQRGFVERVSDGLFRTTDYAREFCDY